MRDIRKLIFQLHMLSLAGKFFAVSGTVSCSDVTERWCEISPALAYTTLNIDPGHSEMIICTVPSTSESRTVNFVNQFGKYVTHLTNVDSYPTVIDDSRSPAVLNYRVRIRWTSDKDIREQLKIIQCVANFDHECSSRPFKTSVISINFLDNGEGSTEPATTSTTVPETTQNVIVSTTRETSTTRQNLVTSTTREESTTQNLMTSSKRETSTRADSGCVCTPSQCATVVPDTERNNNLIQLNQTSHGFKTSYTLNFLLFSAIILLTLLCIS